MSPTRVFRARPDNARVSPAISLTEVIPDRSISLSTFSVKESRRVLDLINDVRARGIPIVLISHNMPHVFEVADRIHVHRLGKRLCVIDPKEYSMSDAVAFMTGAKEPPITREVA